MIGTGLVWGGSGRKVLGRKRNLAKNFDGDINVEFAPCPIGSHCNCIARLGCAKASSIPQGQSNTSRRSTQQSGMYCLTLIEREHIEIQLCKTGRYDLIGHTAFL